MCKLSQRAAGLLQKNLIIKAFNCQQLPSKWIAKIQNGDFFFFGTAQCMHVIKSFLLLSLCRKLWGKWQEKQTGWTDVFSVFWEGNFLEPAPRRRGHHVYKSRINPGYIIQVHSGMPDDQMLENSIPTKCFFPSVGLMWKYDRIDTKGTRLVLHFDFSFVKFMQVGHKNFCGIIIFLSCTKEIFWEGLWPSATGRKL